MKIKIHNLGYPRIGKKRELKKVIEGYWNKSNSIQEIASVSDKIKTENWLTQAKLGVESIPINDFSVYDQVLDLSYTLGNIPERFQKFSTENTELDTLFAIARGKPEQGLVAAEMTKWFDTNYHYIVPEFSAKTEFKLNSQKIFKEFKLCKNLGLNPKPVILGPVSYLILGKSISANFNKLSLLDKLIPVYQEIFDKLKALGAEWIQVDEPALAFNLSSEQKELFVETYNRLSAKILLATYFGELKDNLSLVLNLPVIALHFDLVRAENDIDNILELVPENKIISLGVVDGRNIWLNDYQASIKKIRKFNKKFREVWIAPSCSLLHCPISLEFEKDLNPELKSWLSFAENKLTELSDLKKIIEGNEKLLKDNQLLISKKKQSSRVNNKTVQQRVKNLSAKDFVRESAHSIRSKVQQEILKLPAFPTTTIGSFPQTSEVRKLRLLLNKGELSENEYGNLIKIEIEKCIKFQEEIGLDMLVHGEFERNDMVEYFGENLEGFAFTKNAWVQSYGTRCVKPPIIFGDVSRAKPITTAWSSYAKSISSKPLKGMLTGPITILQWSFVRNDIDRKEIAYQIALAIRDEVKDLESIGLSAIQVDEPALREGLPIRKEDWDQYLEWAVKAFKLSTAVVEDKTQIHTHMCYCEFNDIIAAIANLDADVITIETSRSQAELLKAFNKFAYPNQIGPGVYDIHSPRTPEIKEMKDLILQACEVVPAEKLWVNPDCGLKTRSWKEVEPALVNMVKAAQELRSNI